MSAETTPRRAIWGLVNDGYALVAKTANLSHDEAFELCRVPDIGDPSAYLDQGVAYLRSPKWGHVFARYFTNAERDSVGRASLVYDVVALTDDEFSAIGNNAFLALPPLSADRRPERFGELPPPTLTPRDNGAELDRLGQLLAQEDLGALSTLLGALLAGDRVLAVGATVRPQTIECITLLLPPAVRPLVTFQTPTTDYPKHTPRLTVAERGHALLLEREWTAVLPRDADDPRLGDAKASAARLVTLGKLPERLRVAWTGVGNVTNDLGAAVARILRLDLLNEGLRGGDLRRAVLVPGRAEQSAERRRLADALFDQATAGRIGVALSDVVRGEQRGGWLAAHAIGLAIAHNRDTAPERFRDFFTALIDHLGDVEPPPADPTALSVRVMLACAAAALDDLDRFLAIADPNLPWELAWQDGSAQWVKGRSSVAHLFEALAAKGATYGEALDGLHAITKTASNTNGRSRERVASLALALVRRTLRERAALEPPDRLGALVDVLVRFWTAPVHEPAAAVGSSSDIERVLRRFLGLAEMSGTSSDPRRIAAELSRTLADSPDGAGDEELSGWVIAVLERARAGAIGDASVRSVAALLEEQRRIMQHSDLAGQVGHVLLHFATTDASFVFRPAWMEVTRHVDDASRRELLARALGWAARGYASGRFTIGAFADACAVAGSEGGAIDDATVELLVPHISAAGRRGNATELSMLASIVGSLATPAAAERVIEVLLEAADGSVADRMRMHRLALALYQVERVRDEERYGEAKAALRRVIAAGAISPDDSRTLRTFLAVEDESVIGRLMSRLPRFANGVIAAAGGRE